MAAVLAVTAVNAAAADKAEELKAETWKERVFTAAELKEFDGKSGRPVYVAVDGVVYDLSGVKYWKGGSHMNMLSAGEDHSENIRSRAPKRIHKSGAILSRYPKVGVLAPPKEKDETDKPVVVTPYDSETGLEKFCPVMEQRFVVGARTPVVLYKGERYYMSSPAGPPQFAEDPEKYIKHPRVRAEKQKEALEREKRARAEEREKRKGRKD